jgi:hypothetical protein
MTSFSQRKGLKPKQKIAQIESIDAELRNRIWNALYEWVFINTYKTDARWGGPTAEARTAASLARRFWTDFLKQRSDERPGLLSTFEPLKELILGGPWNEVYDAIEFILATLPPIVANPLGARWNELLKQENAAYRLLNKHVVDITSETEIAEIEDSLTSQIAPVREHIEAALVFVSNRNNPDYRNSIKESISAVESACRLIGGGKTLADALKRIRDRIGLHPALEKGFSALYGYTSDEGGIRHALLEESTLDATDARFMLVACSAFVNFLVSKASELGIKID